MMFFHPSSNDKNVFSWPFMPAHILITLTAESVDKSRSLDSAIVTPPFCRYYIINPIFFQVKYSAGAECEIISLLEIVKYRSLWSRCEMKFALHICEANISQRSYFTWRSHISLAEGEFRWKKHLLSQVLFSELVGQNCNSVKSRILCLRFINIEIIPLNTVLVNRFLKSFCKIIETMSYYFLYLMYKYRLKRGKPILSLSFYATSIFRNSSSAW